MRFERVPLEKLRIEDERSYRHIALYDALKRLLLRDEVLFWVPRAEAAPTRWDRVLFLKLTFWAPGDPADVLESNSISADVMMHAAWHHAMRRAVLKDRQASTTPSHDALFLGEAIASAFDLYLVGRLLGHAPDAAFLEAHVPAMAEAAEQAGMAADAFETMLDQVAHDPDRAFEDLRQLLFDVCMSLVNKRSVDEAAEAIASFDGHRFGPLLHHYDLSTWIVRARAYGVWGEGRRRRSAAPNVKTGQPTEARDAEVERIDAALRHAPVALDWLERHWLNGLS